MVRLEGQMMTNDDGAVVAPKNDKSELKLPSQVDPAIAEQLVDQARTGGVDLVGSYNRNLWMPGLSWSATYLPL